MLPLLATVALLVTGRLDSPSTDRAEKLAKQVLIQHSSPRAAAPLIRLHAMIDEIDDLNLLAQPYSILLARRSTDSHVRTLARMFYADVERARGRTTKAIDVLEPLGFIQDFWVVGGFDNEGKAGCDVDYGPESALDLKASYPAKGREIGWRKLPTHTNDGFVDLSLAVRPVSEAVAYALTFLQAERETTVDLSLGTSGAFRLFVNGVKVVTENRYNQPRVDQSRVQVKLRKGTNRVLLKLCQDTGQLGFFLRQERPSGAASAKVVLPDAVPPPEKGSAPAPVVLPTLTDAMARLVKQSPDDATLRADYASVLAWTRAYEEREHLPATEADAAAILADKQLALPNPKVKAPDVAELHGIAAALQFDDTNLRRTHLERALALDPASAWARMQFAQHELQHEHPDRALPMLDALLKEFPFFAPAHVARIRALDDLRDRAQAHLATEAAFAKLPLLPQIAREAVASSRRMDRFEEAQARGRMALALRFDDLNTRRMLASLLADLGRADEAVVQLNRVLTLDPYDLNSRLRLGELLGANSKSDEAVAAFAECRALAPDEPEVHEREGRTLLHLERREDALAAFTRALVLKPNNPALKEVMRTLKGEDTTQGTRWALPWADEAKALGASNEDAVYLADVTAVRVQSSGISSRFNQLVVKTFTQRGVEAFRQLPITWSPDRQEVRVLKARITKSDGSVVDSFSDSDRNINEPWTGMYYDARARILSFPGLAPGDVLEVQWRLDDTAVENLLSDYWGDTESVQSTYPKRRYRYVVEMPKERPLYWNKATLPKWVSVKQEELEGRGVYRFESENVPRVVPEPQMPGWSEVATVLHVSTYKTWEQVGRYYWGLVREQLVPNDELKKTVDEVLKGIDRKDDQKVLRAIYGFVVTNTRYVALEFGIHGYKPYRVDRVLSRRFGDCKDKASLMTAMLKVAGIDSRLVLLRMRSLGQLDPEPASLSAFNHAIVYVPKFKLFLDGTAEFHGSRELPSADNIANVLIVEPDGPSTFFTTAETSAEANPVSMTFAVTLNAEGGAEAKGTLSVTGQGAPEYRRAYQAAASRKSVFEQAWAQSFPGLKVSEVTMTDPTKIEEPVRLDFAMSTPRYAEALPAALRFFPFGAGRAYTQVLAPLADRKSDVVFSGPWLNAFHFTYAMPTGYVAEELPAEVLLGSPFGQLRIHCTTPAQVLTCDGEMKLTASRVSAKDYPAFREWLSKVDQAFSRKITARRASAGGESAQR